MEYAVDMPSGGMMCIPSLMKIGAAVQAVLRFSLRNLRCCNVCITEGRDL
jgi:hypothetical protein